MDDRRRANARKLGIPVEEYADMSELVQLISRGLSKAMKQGHVDGDNDDQVIEFIQGFMQTLGFRRPYRDGGAEFNHAMARTAVHHARLMDVLIEHDEL